MTPHNTTLLDVLSYLTDPVFMAAAVLVVGAFAALTAIHRIGGRP